MTAPGPPFRLAEWPTLCWPEQPKGYNEILTGEHCCFDVDPKAAVKKE